MAALAVAILVGIVLISRALGPIILLLLAIILAEGIRPAAERLQRYRIRLPLAIMLIYLVLAVIVGLLLWLLLSPLLTQLRSLLEHLPQYQQEIQKQLSDMQKQVEEQGAAGQMIQNLTSELVTAIEQSAPALIAVPFNILTGMFGLFVDLIIVLTMTLFWLLGSRTLKRFVVGLLPVNSQAYASSVIGEVGLAFGGYVRGTLISMLIIGSVTGGGLALLGVPYALLLGVLAGLCELLPYLGPWIAGPISVVLALIASGPVTAVGVVILFILIQELEGNVVEPLVMSHSVHIDPLVVIVVVLVGINLLGIIGAILAIPIAAGVQVLVVRLLAPAIRSISGAPATELSPTAGVGSESVRRARLKLTLRSHLQRKVSKHVLR
jgi:predicted PurR-regulated permease PerM